MRVELRPQVVLPPRGQLLLAQERVQRLEDSVVAIARVRQCFQHPRRRPRVLLAHHPGHNDLDDGGIQGQHLLAPRAGPVPSELVQALLARGGRGAGPARDRLVCHRPWLHAPVDHAEEVGRRVVHELDAGAAAEDAVVRVHDVASSWTSVVFILCLRLRRVGEKGNTEAIR